MADQPELVSVLVPPCEFKPGDSVFNEVTGHPWTVKEVRWAPVMRPIHRNPDFWGWRLYLVDPVDPSRVSDGPASYYRKDE